MCFPDAAMGRFAPACRLMQRLRQATGDAQDTGSGSSHSPIAARQILSMPEALLAWVPGRVYPLDATINPLQYIITRCIRHSPKPKNHMETWHGKI
jgi:hypothetical protein